VKVLWFLFGLVIGLALLGWQLVRLNLRLRKLIQGVELNSSELPFSTTSRLTLAIARQQQIQQELERQIETSQQVLYSAPIGYLLVDDENQLMWCNAAASQLLHIQNYDPTKPRLLLELVRSYELDHLIEQTRSVQQPCQRNWIFYPASSDPSKLSQQQSYPLRGYGLPLLDGKVGVFLENRQEAVSLAQQRDRWTSDVAHELKTPLTSIRLVAETLQARLEPPLRDWVDRLLNETLRLSNLVQDLLDLSQLDLKPTNRLGIKTFDLVKLIHAAWYGLEPLARRKHLQLAYVGPEQLLIQADEPRLHRVFINLLDNSIKYSPTRQQIRVRVVVEEPSPQAEVPQLYLDVVDAGPGFPEAALPYVFDRFYRADPSRSRNVFDSSYFPGENNSGQDVAQTMSSNHQNLAGANDKNSQTQHPAQGVSIEESKQLPESAYSQSFVLQPSDTRDDASERSQPFQSTSGSGLGLAIVRQIVEAHGGRVQARNHPDSGGAWIQIHLPLKQSE
jgi:two-component system, OmpR family, phosphate regulon sensor histidine kinase PhoR